MRRILLALSLSFSALQAEAATIKSIDGAKIHLSLSGNEFAGLAADQVYELKSPEGDTLAKVRLEKIFKGKGILTKVIERSPLLEVNDSVKLKAESEKVESRESEEAETSEAPEKEKTAPSNTLSKKFGLDLRLAIGSHAYSGQTFQKENLAAVELRVGYHFAESPFTIGLHTKTDSLEEENTDVGFKMEQSISLSGLSLEVAHTQDKFRLYGILDLSGGEVESSITAGGISSNASGSVSSSSLYAGVSYLWAYVYVGLEYQLFGSHTLEVGEKEIDFHSRGTTLTFGGSF